MPTASSLPPNALRGGTTFPAYARSRRRVLRRKGHKTLVLASITLLGLIVGLFFSASMPSLLNQQPATPAPNPPASWLEITRPYPFYDLAAPQIAHLRRTYTARRHSTGGGREDALTFGEFAAAETAFLRLTLYRHGAEWVEDPPFFVDMARRAAPLGLSVQHADLTRATPTRFGDFETAELGLAATQARRDNCLGFRLTRGEPGLTIAGLVCGAGGENFVAGEFACLINRLDLLSAGDDRPLRDFFAVSLARAAPNCLRPR